MRRGNAGQTILEYCIITIIVMASFLTMQGYIKRGFQGRWKAALDDMGEQYDPRLANTALRQQLMTQANSSVHLLPRLAANGDTVYDTVRDDSTDSTETKSGWTGIRAP